QGRMRPAALDDLLVGHNGPTIARAQAGNVNTGAVDPLAEICARAREADSWVHADGAFGLWAAASPALRPLLAGVELAGSGATAPPKWVTVRYDRGLWSCAPPDPHGAAMGMGASSLPAGLDGERDAMDCTPDLSRRARGFPIYAAIRALGCAGI